MRERALRRLYARAARADTDGVFAARTPLSRLCAAGMLLLLAGIAGCSDSSSSDSPDEYPLVDEAPPVELQPPVTTPSGAVVTLPVLPTAYEAEPSPTCERALASSPDGEREIVLPPAPGLRAVAVTEHTTRLEWSFRNLPDDCRPVQLVLAVVNGSEPNATPTVEEVDVTGDAGSKEVTYPDFLPAPNVARAAVYSEEGIRSRAVSVLIDRPADTPPNPPEPPRPVTAPAGAPITCKGRATTVEEPAGDVLTYAPGKPPTRVRRLTPALSGIDLTRAAVQINDRTICATFVFARPPTDADFELSFNFADTTEPLCCAALRFRRTAGRLEVGSFAPDATGAYQVTAVPNGGAVLRGATLTITGTLPPPSEWQYRVKRMPAVKNLAWSVTTRYYTDKYGPYFGDWLPRHEPLNQPAIRHRDGAVVRPGR